MPTSPFADIITKLSEDGRWGPPPVADNDASLNDVPYAPYSKGDKLGRMADWTNENGKDGRDNRGGRGGYNRYNREREVYGAGTSALFPQQHAEDESTFSVVDNRSSTKTRTTFQRGGGTVFGRGRGGRGGNAAAGGRGGRGGSTFQRAAGRGGQADGGRGGGRGRGRRFGWKDYDKPQRNRDSSVVIKPEWKMLEEIDFVRLAKLNLETDEGEDVETYGQVYYYDRSYDKASTKPSSKPLVMFDRAWYNITTSTDPVIQKFAEADEAVVFATDSILSTLMCAPRSVYSWDIVINRVGNKLFFDKRDGSSNDYVSVNENATDPPLEVAEGSKDSINSPSRLALEATVINANFAIQVVDEDKENAYKFDNEDPFYSGAANESDLAAKGYRYRRFDLSLNDEEPLNMIVRTEVEAVMKNPVSGEDNFVTVKALNEFDPNAQGSSGALNWRTKLNSQRGAVVATEMKNNSCKLARWTTQAILAKSDVMKIGFVSRVNPKEPNKHVVLGVVGYKPREFANQMNLSFSNGWGIVRTIVDMCMAMPEGKYVLVKDPNKQVLRLYEVPISTFEEEVDAEGEIEEEDEE